MTSVAAYFLTGTTRRGKVRGLKHVGPIIEERLKYMNEYGNDWDGKPVCRLFFSIGGSHLSSLQNDLLSWLIEEAEGPQLRAELLVARVLLVNFAAIHVSGSLSCRV